MARNLSVDQFEQLMRNIPKAVAEELVGTMTAAATQLAGAMKSAVPHGVDGRNELTESIQQRPGSHPLQVKVTAGGELTTRSVRRGASVTYDYALANEYGTRKMTAQPFFWPTYRLLKRRIRAQVQRGMKKGISKVVTLS